MSQLSTRKVLRFASSAVAIAAAPLLFAQNPRTERSGGSTQLDAEARFTSASIAWDNGRYVAAIDGFRALLSGPDSAAFLERIALLSGEKWHTTLVAVNARAPRWSADGAWLAMESGAGANRVTRVAPVAADRGRSVDVKGGALVFAPTEARAMYVMGAGVDGALVDHDLVSGNDRTILPSGLLKAQVAYSADGRTHFVVGAPSAAARTMLYQVTPGGAVTTLVGGDSTIADLQVVSGGRYLVYGIGGRSPLGTGTGTAFTRSGARTRFGIYDLQAGAKRELDGDAVSVAVGGEALVFMTRIGGVSRLFRLALATTSAPELLHTTADSIANPAISPDGARVVFQQMPRYDWELYVVGKAGETPSRLTREIQHDLLPRFLDDRRVLAVVGEARHRRAWIHDVVTGTHTRLFHNNTIRTIAPEYEWVPNADATQVAIVAERDGDTVTPHRYLWRVDLTRTVTLPELRDRLATMRASESSLRADGERRFAPIAAAVRSAVAEVSTDRIYRHEKALFDFDSKHITRPGNLKAREYLMAQYAGFGLATRFQPFEARVAVNQTTVATANVLAVLKGTESPELVYVVSSHFDSRAEGPGADDNTSGTAALLEAARVLSTRPQPATIIFASFTGEESGLLGSREFVRQAKADSLKLVGALNNDMLGWSNDNRLDNTIRYSNTGIRDLQHAAAFLFTRMITYDAFYYKSTDAAAFYDGYGDIVGGIGSYPVLGNPHYHMPHDVLEVENHELIAEASKTTVASLMLLASSPSRITGITAQVTSTGATVTWNPSPEKGIVKYRVTYGPAEAPERWSIDVTAPRAVLANARPGMTVAVKAVNRRGLEGWDWARVKLQED